MDNSPSSLVMLRDHMRSRKEYKDFFAWMEKEFVAETANYEQFRKKEAPDAPFRVAEEFSAQLKFWKIAKGFALKDKKKLQKAHFRIMELDSDSLDNLMELDQHFAESDVMLIGINSEENRHWRPGKDGLTGLLLEKSNSQKDEYELRKWIVNNWEIITRR